MTGRLDGLCALVTGGGSGIGMAVAQAFLREGAQVCVVGRTKARLDELVAQSPERSIAVVGDVRSYGDNDRAVKAAVDRFGKLDVFVGNAGVWDFMRSLDETSPEDLSAGFDELFGINVKGYLLGAKAALPALARSGGSMIFSLSNASFYVAGGGALYTASKHAGVGLVRQLAYELAPRIRVNGVALGAAETDLRGPSSIGLADASLKDVPLKGAVEAGVPIAKLPPLEAYAAPFVMLASTFEGQSMTGSILQCDGGVGVRGFPQTARGGALEGKYGSL